MKRLARMLHCKKGNSYPLAIAIALGIIIILFAGFEYMRLMLIAQGVRDGVQSAIISVSTENYSDVYAALREGYSGGFVNEGSGFREQVRTGDIYAKLSQLLGLKRDGSSYVKYIDGDVVEYRVSNLSVRVINTPFAPSDRNAVQQFRAEATIHLEVPLSFGWSNLPPMRMTLRTVAGWTPKF